MTVVCCKITVYVSCTVTLYAMRMSFCSISALHVVFYGSYYVKQKDNKQLMGCDAQLKLRVLSEGNVQVIILGRCLSEGKCSGNVGGHVKGNVWGPV